MQFRPVWALAGFVLIQSATFAQTPTSTLSDPDRVKMLVEAGALPRSALAEAETAVADAQDNEILRRTLYGNLGIEQLTEGQTEEMIAAAQRRLDRQREKVERAQKLVDSGVAAKASLDSVQEEFDARKLTLDLAVSRANVFRQVAEMARAERNAQIAAGSVETAVHALAVKYEGDGVFQQKDFPKIEQAYEKEFGKALPVSAVGETALHRALGFDHRGRIDIALNPDQLEGVWLRHYLEQHHVPYFAFRAAMPGSATGAHIHLGTPSPRLSVAD